MPRRSVFFDDLTHCLAGVELGQVLWLLCLSRAPGVVRRSSEPIRARACAYWWRKGWWCLNLIHEDEAIRVLTRARHWWR